MSRARILADYVAGGTTAAEFDYLDGVTSNIQTQFTAKAPLASPAFTGTPTGITAAHITSGALPVGVTGGSGLTALGTVISAGTGSVLQVKSADENDDAYANTTTWGGASGTGVSNVGLRFTPLNATSDIFLLATFGAYTAGTYAWYDFYKDATDFTATWNLSGAAPGLSVIHTNASWTNASISFKDVCTENSLSEKTYKISFRSYASGNTYVGDGVQVVTLTAFEIAT